MHTHTHTRAHAHSASDLRSPPRKHLHLACEVQAAPGATEISCILAPTGRHCVTLTAGINESLHPFLCSQVHFLPEAPLSVESDKLTKHTLSHCLTLYSFTVFNSALVCPLHMNEYLLTLKIWAKIQTTYMADKVPVSRASCLLPHAHWHAGLLSFPHTGWAFLTSGLDDVCFPLHMLSLPGRP